MTQNIIRRIAGAVTAVLLLAMLPMQAAFGEEKSGGVDQALDFLTRIGVMDTVNVEEIDREQTVSRGDFSVYFAQMLDLDTAAAKQLYYTDLPENHYAFRAVTALTEAGYLSGIGEKRFEPDSPMLMRDAQTLLLKALGLMHFINSGNADAAFLHRIIRDSDIMDGVSETAEVSYGSMMIMLRNALIADYYSISQIGEESEFSYANSGRSLLYETRKMNYERNKLMTAANGGDIYGMDEDENTVVIDGVRYSAGGSDYSGLLGRYVDFAYRADDENDTLVWATVNESSRVLEITIEENEEGYNAQTGQFCYEKNGREQRAQIAANAAVIYNGKFLSSGITDELFHLYSRVTLLSSTKSGSYDIVIIEDCRNLFVSGVDVHSLAVHDRVSGETLSLDPSDYDVLRITDKDNRNMAWSDIQNKDVLSVFASKDQRFMRVVVSKDAISGTVDQIADNNEVSIDGTVYKVADAKLADSIALGASLTAYLDYRGYIAAVEAGMSPRQFVGFALKGVHVTSGLDDVLKLKILSEDGSINDYTVEQKIRIDDVLYKDLAQAFQQLSTDGNKFQEQIMLCRLDSNGNLVQIDRAYPDDGLNHPLTINRQLDKELANVNQAMYMAGQNRIGLTMLTDANTKVFFVPENLGNDFSRCIVSGLRAWDDYRGATSYRITAEDTFVEQYIVTRQLTYGTVASTHPLRMFDQVYDTVDDEGNPYQMFVCTDGSSTTEYRVSEYLDLDAYGLKRGDAIRVATTATNNGVLEYFNIIDRADSTAALNPTQRVTPYMDGRTISCYGYDKLGYYLKVGWDSGEQFDEIFKLTAGTPVVVYDSEEDEIYIGGIDDIETYRTNGVASRLLVQTQQGTLQRIFVYR